jgi:hypothetical protein
VTGGLFNNINLHFDSTTHTAHVISHVVYAYAVVVAALPTALWLMAFAALAAQILWRQRLGLPELDAVCLLACAGPAAAGLLQIPVGHRYLNLSLFLLAIWITARFFAALAPLVQTRARQTGLTAASLGLAALVVIETAPFRPLFAAFRPLWLEYPDPDKAVLGKLNPSWLGWGEEAFIAGTELERRCLATPQRALDGVPCGEITLYAVYPGLWLGDHVIKSTPHGDVRGKEPLTKDAYYVFNRSFLVQGFPAPEALTPEFKIAFRGFTQAWVYRGDRLATAGYKFP